MGVDAEDIAVMESSTGSPGEKAGGSMASVMEIEGGARVVMLMFTVVCGRKMLYRHRLKLNIQRQRPWQGLSKLGKTLIRGSTS
jgi:hypothetical protein